MRVPLYNFNDDKQRMLTYRGFTGGINQAVDQNVLSNDYSPNAQNVDLSGGILSTSSGYSKKINDVLAADIKSIMVLYIYSETGARTAYIIAATDDNIYYYDDATPQWVSIKGSETITSGRFAFTNYQDDDNQIIILTNGVDHVFCWDGSGNIEKLYYIDASDHAPKGKCIALHYERIWIGADPENTQKVYYSDDMDPDNWNYASTGAGEINFPTFDGDRVIAIANLLDDIVVFKEKSIFVIKGSYPGEYSKAQVFSSDGTIAAKSVCAAHDRSFYLSDRGIMIYYGSVASPLEPYRLNDFYESINDSYVHNTAGIVHDGMLYMAVPTGESTTNDKVIEYNLTTKSFMIRDIQVGQFLAMDNELLFYKPNTRYVLKYNTGDTYDGQDIAMRWDTAISDFKAPNSIKTIRKIYIDAWGIDDDQLKITPIADGVDMTSIILTLPNTRGVLTTPLTACGRKLGFKIENVSGSKVNIASINAVLEIRED